MSCCCEGDQKDKGEEVRSQHVLLLRRGPEGQGGGGEVPTCLVVVVEGTRRTRGGCEVPTCLVVVVQGTIRTRGRRSSYKL